MSFLKNLFGKKESPVRSYNEFWNWFLTNEKTFAKVVKNSGNIEKDFFMKLSPKLSELKEGFFYLTGMYDAHTVELVFTADGAVINIAFVEALVASAPPISGWKFTALKPPITIADVNITMDNYQFNRNNIHFFPNEHRDFPDEIDITVVHDDLVESNKDIITNGTFIFLDNLLGELDFTINIDSLNIVGKEHAPKDLIPVEKLRSYLTWRQKEFVEKYDGARHNTAEDHYAGLEATLDNGRPLVAIVNTTLLDWDRKASHPWILVIEIAYNGIADSGLPDQHTYHQLDAFEQEVSEHLKSHEGYLNIGRQTADGVRQVYLACKDFRKPSLIMHDIVQKVPPNLSATYNLYKDKYWQSFERFRQ